MQFYNGLDDFKARVKPSAMPDDLFLNLLSQIGANMLVHASTSSGQNIKTLFLETLDAFQIPPPA